MSIVSLKHPEYASNFADWERYRYILTGGRKFIEKYLQRFSEREENKDFDARSKMSYNPAHAEAALLEIRNSIYQRLADVVRTGGSDSYHDVILGNQSGVDLKGHNIMDFLGEDVILELLGMGKVGVYVDMPTVDEGETKADSAGKHPYCYIYKAENILSWTYSNGQLITLLLSEYEDELDEVYGLTSKRVLVYRLLNLTSEGVSVRFFSSGGEEKTDQAMMLKLTRIPFVLAELSHSILKNIDGYQVALLNLASSDLNYALKANFTFYTEQFDPGTELVYLRQALSQLVATDGDTPESGSAAAAATAKLNEIKVGAATGRRYVKGLERPDFIGPPTAPITASMEKQRELRKEIREIVNLNVSNLEPKRESADAKAFNQRSLEAGLSYIGLELQYTEREIAEIWHMYLGDTKKVTISYPRDYSLKTETERHDECKTLRESCEGIESVELQKEVAKTIVTLCLGHKIPKARLEQIHAQIDSSVLGMTTREIIEMAMQNQLLSNGTGAKLLGLPPAEAEAAKKDHADRVMLTIAAQAKITNPASRGAPDMDPNPDSGKDEKKS
jgi:hypothetical protein